MRWGLVAWSRYQREGTAGILSYFPVLPSSRRTRHTEEQKVYRAARRRANVKLSFISHFVAYATVCLFLVFVAGLRPAFIVALSWGIGIVFHYFFAMVAPELLQRLIDREVHREVPS